LGDTLNQLLARLEDLNISTKIGAKIPTALLRDRRDLVNVPESLSHCESGSGADVQRSEFRSSSDRNVGDGKDSVEEDATLHFSREDFEQVAQLLGRSLLSRHPGYQGDFYCPDDDEDLLDFDLSKPVIPNGEASFKYTKPNLFSSITDFSDLLKPANPAKQVDLISGLLLLSTDFVVQEKLESLFEEEKESRFSEADLLVEPSENDEDLFSRMDQLFLNKKAEKNHNRIPKDTLVERRSIEDELMKKDAMETGEKWDYIFGVFK
jgi:hypothetical protein